MQTSNADTRTSIGRWQTRRQSRREVLRLLAGAGLGTAGLAAITSIATAAPSGGGGVRAARLQEGTSPSQSKPQLGKRADGTTVWRVQAGAMNMTDLLDAMAFLPEIITINAGDAIFWDFSGDTEEFHTASFRSGAPLPPLLIPDSAVKGQLIANPAAAYPAGGTTYDGTGFVSSGLSTLPGMKPFVLTFTQPGTYEVDCLVHYPAMLGMVTVQEKGTALPYQQAEYDAIAADQLGHIWDDGKALVAKYSQAGSTRQSDGTTRWNVMVGGVQGQAMVMRFTPDTLTIKKGDTVHWLWQEQLAPHTVTFSGTTDVDDILIEPQPNKPPKLVLNPKILVPAGGKVYSGKGFFNSSIFGPAFNGPTTYELTFDTPGTYVYYCALHGDPTSGMRGTIVVT